MLASDIVGDVREFLNDTSKNRYSDAYLLKLLNEGLLDLSKRLRLFKSEASIPFVKGQSIYSLPLDFIEFDDISLNGEIDSINFASRADIVKLGGKNWRTKEIDGAPTHIIYNKQTFYQFRTYPIPTGNSIYELYTIDTFGFPSEITDIESPDTFGVFPSLEDIVNSILFDPAKINNDLDVISNQVNFLAQQVSTYSQAISANSVAIQQVYGISASAQATAQAAQLAASTAVTTVNSISIIVDNISNDIDDLETSISTITSSIVTLTASVSSAQATADAASTAASNAQDTADAGVTIANSVKARIDSISGGGSIEALAANVTTLSASVTSAVSTANAASAAAGAANTTAGTAVNTASSALTVANSVKARIDSISGGGSIEALAANVTTISATVTTANATAASAVTIANNVNARVGNISGGPQSIESLATSVTTLTASVGSNTATLAIHASAIAALESGISSWEIVTDVNDLTNGFGIYNNGVYEEVVFRTNNFKVYPNTGNTGALSFSVESGQVKIPNAMITNIIQSDNFVTGVSGWKIDKATGLGEFQSLTARGTITATALNAATGTFSGTLTAAAINAVNTINIADQSIVVDTTAFNANNLTLNTANLTILSKSITMSNANSSSTIGIQGSFSVTLPSNGEGGGATPFIPGMTITVRVVRDGTQIAIFSKPVYSVTDNGTRIFASGEIFVNFLDQPGAGTFNYQMQFVSDNRTWSSTNYIAYDRYLRLSGGKK